MTQTITTYFPDYLYRLGDRIKISSKPNSHMDFIRSVDTPNSFTIETIIKPSRGWRRHVRKMKAKQ